MTYAFALINHTDKTSKHTYFEAANIAELRSFIASVPFRTEHVLRIYEKPGSWVLVGPPTLDETYAFGIDRPMLQRDFALILWNSALARLSLRKQNIVATKMINLSKQDVVTTATIIPFTRDIA